MNDIGFWHRPLAWGLSFKYGVVAVKFICASGGCTNGN